MKGQLSLFTEEIKAPVKLKKNRKCVSADPSQTFDERMKRFWHYMNTKDMNEQWIETCAGELRIIIDALADYREMAGKSISAMNSGYGKSVWEDRMERIKKIQEKLEESTGYNREKQIEICMKKKPQKDDDIGEDALVLASRG